MADKVNFSIVFEQLKRILQKYESNLVVQADTPGNYYLSAGFSQKYQKELMFGAVQIKKNYVSFYLFPVYMFPDLLNDLSPQLKTRMQGKSCLNFSKRDAAIVVELAALSQKGVGSVRHDQVM